jgi:dienelactone hydrolase
MKRLCICTLLALLGGNPAMAEVKTQAVTYDFDGTTLKGYLAWDNAVSGKRPGVLVVHEWWGLNEYARKRAEMLAKMGYVAFACDMYGDGKVAAHPNEAGQLAGEVRKNSKTWHGRALAGLQVLRDNDKVDGKRLAAIGYCFGGSTVLELALSGADVSAVVSFHGALPAPTEEQAKAVKARVLVCHGALDGFITEKAIQEFRGALDKAHVDYQFVYYAGAKHSFTVEGADKRGIDGIKYNAHADHRSWQHMKLLFDEVFAPGK